MQIEVSILAHVNDVRKPLVHGIAFRLGLQLTYRPEEIYTVQML